MSTHAALTRILSAIAIALAGPLAGLTLAAPLSVGGVTASPGQRSDGYLKVPAGVDGAIDIPVVVIEGQHPGPVLALVSGLHGTEYASTVALEELLRRVKPSELTGTLIVLPLVNVESFRQKTPHVNPVDRKSMNRFFPGREDGTQTERALALITRQVVEKADFLIDYHGGDLDENLRPYSYYAPFGDEKQDRVALHMALAFGLDHVIIERDHPTDIKASKYLSTTAALRGRPTLVVEAGYAGTVDRADVAALLDGTLNVMRYLKLLPGAAPEIAHPVWIGRIDSIKSAKAGLFYPLVQRGTYVAEGMQVGYVTDFFGNTIHEAYAPAAGIILYICSVPSMATGETIANVGVPGPAP